MMHLIGYDKLKKQPPPPQQKTTNQQEDCNTVTTTPDIQCYNIVLNEIALTGDYQLTERLFQQLLTDYMKRRSNVEPDYVTLHTTLKAHLIHTSTHVDKKTRQQHGAKASDAAESAEQFLQRLENFVLQQEQFKMKTTTTTTKSNENMGHEESDTSTNTSITEEDDDDDVDNNSAHQDYRYANIKPTVRAYTTVLSMWTKLGEADRAVKALELAEQTYLQSQQQNKTKNRTGRMLKYNDRPDIVSYHDTIICLSKAEPQSPENADRALEIVQKMVNVNHIPWRLTCNTVISCLTSAGQPEKAEEFLEKTMKNEIGVTPDMISYNTLIHGYAMHNEMPRALAILDGLLSTSSLSPNIRSFTSILTALSRMKTLESAKQAEEFLFQMQELHDTSWIGYSSQYFCIQYSPELLGILGSKH